MHFGRDIDPGAVAYKLPPSREDNEAFLRNELGPKPPSKEVIYALPLWNDKALLGSLYPPDAKIKNFLKHYAHQFQAIELNASFYKLPEISTLGKWKEQVARKDFEFCLKVPQSISHRKDWGKGSGQWDRFWVAMDFLGSHRGPCFMQLPPYFGPDRLAHLIHFCSEIPEDTKFHLELRHQDWFSDPGLMDELVTVLREKKIGWIITDTPGRRDVIHQSLTNQELILRWNGNNGHPVDEKRILEWTQVINRWFEQGLQKVYFFLHQPDKSLCEPIFRALEKGLSKNIRRNNPEFYKTLF